MGPQAPKAGPRRREAARGEQAQRDRQEARSRGEQRNQHNYFKL